MLANWVNSACVKTFPVGFKGLHKQIIFVLGVIKASMASKFTLAVPAGIAKVTALAFTASIE